MGMLAIDDRMFLVFEDDGGSSFGPGEYLPPKCRNSDLFISVSQQNDRIAGRIASSGYAHANSILDDHCDLCRQNSPLIFMVDDMSSGYDWKWKCQLLLFEAQRLASRD